MIHLYETNGGTLILRRGQRIWEGLEQTDSTFRDDAQAILNYQTADWTIESRMFEGSIDIIAHIETKAVARYTHEGDILLEHEVRPGRSALRYLGATLYTLAEKRVQNNAYLLPMRDIIMSDWPEGEAHWWWVATGLIHDITRWAGEIKADQED
jgi:hypothetical protein